ncbi:hypothetical protein [Streptomyces sp. NPDC089919]|uniref:hypothetical protein n=1 Tax=Streptomyces sp. NPDC089919 TaxID=3155188 RepID=UPI00342369FA
MARLRAAAVTEPGRLRIIGAVLAALVVLFGVVTAWQITDRSAAAQDVVGRSQPLSADAASIYRSLADADTASSSGFLAGSGETREVRERYEKDIANASRLLVKAAANAGDSPESARQISLLNEGLPGYTGLIEQARANNRQGLPLGGAYLRYANDRMSTQLLPAAQKLYEEETRHLYDDYAAAGSWPLAALAAGLAALAALGWMQRRTYLRTHRVFNHGLLAATAASAVVLLWLTAGHAVARSDLLESREHGQESLKVLNDARISSLQARANENLTLVSRGAVLAADKKSDKYDVDFGGAMARLDARLAAALKLADDAPGTAPVDRAMAGAREWRKRHAAARSVDLTGDYQGALDQVIGGTSVAYAKSSGACFDTVDAALEAALAHEQRQFTRAAQGGLDAFGGLVAGAGALAALGAAGALLGIGRRLSEYR